MSNRDKSKLSYLSALDQLQKPKAFSSNNQDRKGAKTAPIDNNFVSKYLFYLCSPLEL